MTKHALYSASSAERWMNCYGSQQEIAKLPPSERRSSPQAAQGTFAHHVASVCLSDPLRNDKPSFWLGNKSVIDGHTVEVDQEMVDGVQYYIDDCDTDRQDGDVTWVELELIEALATLHPELGGTGDYARYRKSAKHLLVTDFKYGSGIVVDAVDNKQLKMYALGVLLKTGVGARSVTVRIVQPRAEHAEGRTRDFTFDAVDILDFAADVVDAIEESMKPGALLTPGPWCRKTFCPAAATCPALEARQHALVKADFTDVVPYNPKDLATALDQIEFVKARIKALEEFAYNEANRGIEIPGWKLVAKRPTRKVVQPAHVVVWAKSVGIDPYEAPELKSPAQLEKSYADTAPRGQKKAYAEKAKAALVGAVESISSGSALVPVSDDRAPIKRLEAADFDVVPEQTGTAAVDLF